MPVYKRKPLRKDSLNNWKRFASDNLVNTIPLSNRDSSRAILVKNLNKETLPGTLMNYFDKYEMVEEVSLNFDDNNNLDQTATVVFKKIPIVGIPKVHTIDSKNVNVEFTQHQASEPFASSSNNDQTFMKAHCLSLGSMKGPKEFVDEWDTKSDITFIVNYSFRDVQILFSHLQEEYKLNYHFKDVFEDMYVEREENGTTYFTIRLQNPAEFSKRKHDVLVSETVTSIKRRNQWERVIYIPKSKDQSLPSFKQPLDLEFPEGFVNINSWIVYRLKFSPPAKYLPKLNVQLKEAAKFNLVPQNLDILKPFIKVVKASSLPKPLGHYERANLGLKYKVLYLLESAISYNYFNVHNLTKEFYDAIKELNADIASGILNFILDKKQRVWNPLAEFRHIFDKMGIKVKQQRKVPSHCEMLCKVIVTPSHIYVNKPSLEATNRVVRHYHNQANDFLRLQFTDEGFHRVGPAGPNADQRKVIYDRIYRVLRHGIQIGEKKYVFLAFSSSQLRQHGCWFFAPNEDLTAEAIRDWMGVFSHEKIVAKHAVRMGQCFSTTIPTYDLEPGDVTTIPDIVRNGYTFSDGVGKISPSLAKEVAVRLDLQVVPSAFQFRLGGAKGVLTVDHKETNGLQAKVQLRPSQTKFESNHLTLEVLRSSTYSNGYLNRQAITILSCLGIKDDVFMEFMNEMVQNVNKLLKKPEEAVRVLLQHVDEAGTAHAMVSIIQAGFMARGDPYIMNLLNLFRVNVLKDLKKKAKILVPKGAYLLGVMDETGTLEEGEVFVQICDTSNNGVNKQIITGKVVVFRNPCFHPGDIRVVKAVNREALSHLEDVIVFSSKGYRDLPSMLSGGDLDGDDYTVFWDERLIPAKNFPPMDYTAPPPTKVEKVEIINIVRFFVNYIFHDNLGMIANAHLATADQSPVGARDGKCIVLAQKHSEAVDFPKSGIPAVMTYDLMAKKFPDFMQKKDKPQYISEKVLGRIFRAIDKSDYKDYQSTLTDEAVYDVRVRVPQMEIYIAEARELRFEYNRNLLALMNQFGVQTEAEAVSGFVIKWVKKSNKKSRYEHHDITMKAMKRFKAYWKAEFEREFLKENGSVDPLKKHLLEAKAAAWYYVTYHPNERKKDMSLQGGFLSFPWCILQYVCEIAKRNNCRDRGGIDLEARIPFTEDCIEEGRLKLQSLRNDSAPIVILEDTNDNDDDYESEDEDSSDDEVVEAYLKKIRNIATSVYPLVDLAPLSYQTILPLEANDDDMARVLLGNND